MPSRYSSEGTRSDARTISENLGVQLYELPIEAATAAYDELLAEAFAGREPDLTEENLQARVRGNLVMALSNKFGWLVLTTGNKSEMSVGYATLYGDMAGGFAVLKDVFKQWVYRLVRWRNEQAGRELVPASVLERPPSAELRYEQRDDQSLPPYDVLDAILEGYVEDDLDAGELVERGPARGRGEARDPDGRPGRVQAPPGAARGEDLAEGVRARPAAADHEPLAGIGRTAIVTRVIAHRRPASSVKSTSHNQVVRPLWRRRASAWMVPSLIGRRKLVWFDMPTATLPSG